jgi:hypothetical protein
LSRGLRGALTARLRMLGRIAAGSSILAVVFGRVHAQSDSAMCASGRQSIEGRPLEQESHGTGQAASASCKVVASVVARAIPALRACGVIDSDFIWPLLSVLFATSSAGEGAEAALTLMASLSIQQPHVCAIQKHMDTDATWPLCLGANVPQRLASILQAGCKSGAHALILWKVQQPLQRLPN